MVGDVGSLLLVRFDFAFCGSWCCCYVICWGCCVVGLVVAPVFGFVGCLAVALLVWV